MLTFSSLCAFGLMVSMAPAGSLAHDESLQDLIVQKHNRLRESVSPEATNMLKMSWNKEAAINAQRRANTCSLSSKSDKREISTGGCGENIYVSTFNNSWDAVIQSWFNEGKNWRYGEGSVNGKVVGHFTQVVWYKSHQVGCARAECTNSFKYIYVCHYCPPGNYQFTHPYTSGSSCADCPNNCDNKLCTNPCQYIDLYSNCPDLKQAYSCDNTVVSFLCPASCNCTDQII